MPSSKSSRVSVDSLTHSLSAVSLSSSPFLTAARVVSEQDLFPTFPHSNSPRSAPDSSLIPTRTPSRRSGSGLASRGGGPEASPLKAGSTGTTVAERVLPWPPKKPPEQRYHSFLCIDFESTCVDRTLPRYAHLSPAVKDVLTWEYPNEIVEWPVVLLQWRMVAEGTKSVWELMEVASWRRFVKPTWGRVLTQFCQELTGISLNDIKHASPLDRVVEEFDRTFVKPLRLFTPDNKTVWATDGPWDLRDHLQKSLFLCPTPSLPRYLSTPGLRFIDLRHLLPLFLSYYQLPPAFQPTLVGSLAALGLTFTGREHSGLDDARNVGRCLRAMVQISTGKVGGRGRWSLRENRTVETPRAYPWMGANGVCTWVDPAAGE